jgi:hypothetical protein
MHKDYDSRLHRQKHRQNDERGCLQRDDIGCRQEWVPPSGGGRMDDSRHFPYAPRDERAFSRNESVVGPLCSALIPANERLHGSFGRDYPRDVQVRDLHHARGGASGNYNDRGGKCGGDEERGREKDRYTERDENRNWQCDADSARDRDTDRGSDRDREYTQSGGPTSLLHGNEVNNQIFNNSDTIEHVRVRDGPDTQKDRGKDRGEHSGSDRNDRNNERDRNRGCQRSRDGDRDRDRDRDRGSGRGRQYMLTQRPRNIELSKQIMRISDTRELCDFV